jgi:predicted nucleic acid-binding protein
MSLTQRPVFQPKSIKPDQQRYLEANYKKYSNATLAKMIGATENQVNYWLQALGLKKNEPVEPLEEWQKRFIIENYSERTVQELAAELRIEKHTRIISFIQSTGLKKAGVVVAPKKKVKFKRAKPDHQNMNHEERINFWLSLDLSNIKGRLSY